MSTENDQILGIQGVETITFREICLTDRVVIQKLHEEFFPIRYTSQFYDEIVQGRGLGGARALTIMACNSEGEVVGFLLAQLVNYPGQGQGQGDVRGLFALPNPQFLCYILTLGVRKQYRRLGIAQDLVRRCVEYARSFAECGGVYLHVLDDNKAARALYAKAGLKARRALPGFYRFPNPASTEEVDRTAVLCLAYLNNYQPPIVERVFDAVVETSQRVASAFNVFLPSNLRWEAEPVIASTSSSNKASTPPPRPKSPSRGFSFFGRKKEATTPPPPPPEPTNDDEPSASESYLFPDRQNVDSSSLPMTVPPQPAMMDAMASETPVPSGAGGSFRAASERVAHLYPEVRIRDGIIAVPTADGLDLCVEVQVEHDRDGRFR